MDLHYALSRLADADGKRPLNQYIVKVLEKHVVDATGSLPPQAPEKAPSGRYPVLYELDIDGDPTGVRYIYCSDACAGAATAVKEAKGMAVERGVTPVLYGSHRQCANCGAKLKGGRRSKVA